MKISMECPSCHSHKLVWDYKRSELSCKDCGLVLSEPQGESNIISYDYYTLYGCDDYNAP